ncbi:MAG TPA: patatin-like phospholipase family protein [Saprospiraceae bacterium]|nr:patatin-like phospholipase family protein [Saprospiraceae bacterium]
MKALVISGGGSKGAWAGGLVEYLSRERGMEWDVLIGSSTGSLLVPCIAVKAWDDIKRAYTTSSQKEIFSNCPFIVRKKDDKMHTTFNHLSILMQFIQQRKTLGESKSLRNLIRQTFTRELWRTMKSSGKVVIVTVSNLTHNLIEYKYARDYGYEEFCDWIWISCNLVPFMSLAIKNGCEYADGGFGNPIPIQEVINLGASEIDVVVLQPRHRSLISPPASNAFILLLKTYNFMQHQLSRDDISVSLAETRHGGTKIRLIHTPEELTDNSFIFDPNQMSEWWQMGHQHAEKIYNDGFWKS